MDPLGASTGEKPCCKNKLPERWEELAYLQMSPQMFSSSEKTHTAFKVDSSESFSIFLFTLRGLTVRLCQ